MPHDKDLCVLTRLSDPGFRVSGLGIVVRATGLKFRVPGALFGLWGSSQVQCSGSLSPKPYTTP